MIYRCLSSVGFILILVLDLVMPGFGVAQELGRNASPATPQPSELSPELTAVEQTIEAARQTLGVPGAAIVIVKDDHVIFQKGFGLRNAERNLPVTPETLFAIGSCTKAFTAMAAVMSADRGKLSLDDSPKKYLPYFRLQDPEAEARITVRDLMTHSSGLMRTDLVWIPGVLTRKEVIKAAGLAEPTARLHERFQYQNIMYSAAGEVVARANRSSWEEDVARRFFRPLGMRSTNTSIKEMRRFADFASGYNLNGQTAVKVPMRDVTSAAPAGAINSNLKDMAQWVRLMLGNGVFEGKRFVSEQGFDELTKEQIAFGAYGYGLGWFIGEWRGHRMLFHGGNVDGFNAMVALLPDQNIGFAILTNVFSSLLPDLALETIFSNLVDPTPSARSAMFEAIASGAPVNLSEASKFLAGRSTIMEALKDRRLYASLSGPLFVPLASMASGREAQAVSIEAPVDHSSPYQELFGRYEQDGLIVEIGMLNDRLVLVLPGNLILTLVERHKDHFGLAELPDGYGVVIKRNEMDDVIGLTLLEPGNLPLEFNRLTAVAISIDELMANVIAAAGGEANMRRHRSLASTSIHEYVNQAVTAQEKRFAQAPNQFESQNRLFALGKKIGTIRTYFDGTNGRQESSFSSDFIFTGRLLENLRIEADFYGLLNWKTLYQEVRIEGLSTFGGEKVYVVVKTPRNGDPTTDYISAESFLLLKNVTLNPEGLGTVIATYSDYRLVDGVRVSFRSIIQDPSLGRIISHLKKLEFDVEFPDADFIAETRR
jgi:CubicO group peptidase (beta-lactamase class C family)